MKSGKQWSAGISIAFLLSLMIIVTACSFKMGVPQWSGSGFVRKELLEYKSVAVLPFEGDDSGEISNAFASNFHEKFPQISIVDRKRVLEVFRGRTLTPDRLDEKERLGTGNTLSA